MTHIRVRSDDQLAQFVHDQDTKRKPKRNTPEHSRNRSSTKDALQESVLEIQGMKDERDSEVPEDQVHTG